MRRCGDPRTRAAAPQRKARHRQTDTCPLMASPLLSGLLSPKQQRRTALVHRGTGRLVRPRLLPLHTAVPGSIPSPSEAVQTQHPRGQHDGLSRPRFGPCKTNEALLVPGFVLHTALYAKRPPPCFPSVANTDEVDFFSPPAHTRPRQRRASVRDPKSPLKPELQTASRQETLRRLSHNRKKAPATYHYDPATPSRA